MRVPRRSGDAANGSGTAGAVDFAPGLVVAGVVVASWSAAACRAVSAGRVTTKTCATAYVAASATPIATAAWPVSSSVLSRAAASTPPRCTNCVSAPVAAADQPEPGGAGRAGAPVRPGAARQSDAVAVRASASPAPPATATPAIAPLTPAVA